MKNLLKSFPVFIIAVLAAITLSPIPAILLDILITVNLMFAFLILFAVVSLKEIKKFKLLPTAILLSIVFSLAINISAVRLILTKGTGFDGRVIRFISIPLFNSGTIGHIIGCIIFILLMSILIIIITKGGTRVSEIAARFTLDSIQVKMMATEAELESGAITKEEAVLRKQRFQQESDFFVSVNGASKFILGNVKFVIFAAIIVIIAGTLMEYFFRDVPLNDAISNYLGLSISTGLLFMLPPILLSMSIGVVVTREAARCRVKEGTL